METTVNEPQPDGVAIDAVVTPALLPADHQAIVDKWLADGWAFRERRRQVITIALSSAQVAELGSQAADLDVVLRDRRQAKNARAAAMQREKKGLEGAVTAVAVRIQARSDELGRPLNVDNLADYARAHAARSDELDRYEEQRKEELTAMREELADLEDQRKALALKVRVGRGDYPVWMADFTDFAGGEVVSVRLDDGSVHTRRPLPEHDRQMEMFGSRTQAEPLTEQEYALAISGRLQDAAWSYHKRLHTTVSHAQAMLVIRKELLPNEAWGDEELPPEYTPHEVVTEVIEGEFVVPDEPSTEIVATETEPASWDVVVKDYEPTAEFRSVAKRLSTLKPSELTRRLKLIPDEPAVIVTDVSRAAADGLVEELLRVGAVAGVVAHAEAA